MSSWDIFISGDPIGGIINVYSGGALAPLGTPFFYSFMIFVFMGAIYFKSQNLNTIGILGMVLSGLVIANGKLIEQFPDYAMMPAYFVMVVSVFIVFYKLWKG